ncbi:MAG: glycosyltransferase family 9 protein [Bacteroidota bacterium]
MRLLVIRFSSMGDVALTVPAVRGILESNPDVEITMVSNSRFEPFFYDIDRLTFYGVNLKDYEGLAGLWQLFRELKNQGEWNAVIDLHSVMRTWIIGSLFRFSAIPVHKIDKGRVEKKQLVRKENKVFKKLKHTTERYLDVFRAFGLEGELASGDVLQASEKIEKELDQFLEENGFVKNKTWIGIAPYSLHKQKTWPLSKVTTLIESLGEKDCQVFLLGGREEAEDLNNLASVYPHCVNAAGVFSLEKEIALMHRLDVVVAMDSFNMHLAALCNTKVVSIWGGTHHYAGFGPLNNNEQFIVEVLAEELSCRPCSVFGDKPCYRGDWACLNDIEVEGVLNKLG